MNPITPDTPDGEEQPTNLGSTTPSIGAKRKLTTDQHWIASSFTPSQLIRLSDEEAAVAAYIFGKSSKRETDETDKTDDTEILVRANVRKEIALTTHLKAKYAFEEFALRSGLKTMMPGKLGKVDRVLVLPNQLFAIFNVPTGHKCRRYEVIFQRSFMSHIDFLKKIYIPIDVGCHWILLVVDK
ncbi:hypothetical protein RIF29_24695 [Crotalaria pallida]|uniref:Ubiquitin-like protease family profile domain-containing protein n=1 Tax=Crotalaria pallida TaxID=3830 RepID=A0AAN9EL29_CROPI